MRKLINNPGKTALAVVLFLVMAFSYRGCEADEGYLEMGPTFTGKFNGGVGLVYTERLSRFDVGLMLVSEQGWNGNTVANNGGLMVSSVFKKPASVWGVFPDEAHLGAAYWVKSDAKVIGCQLGFNLGVRYLVGKRFHVGWRHWSNAGTCKPNRGQDLLVVGFRF